MQTIPMTSDGKSEVSVNLGEGLGSYTFETLYNRIAGMWFLNLYDDMGSDLLLGAAMVPNIDLVDNLGIGIGRLIVVDNSDGLNGNTTPDSLGDTAQLIHFNPGEFESLYPESQGQPPAVNVDLDDVLIGP